MAIVTFPRVFAIIVSLLCSCEVALGSNSNMMVQRDERLNFILPSFFEELGRMCNPFSRFFCLAGYVTATNSTSRLPEIGDKLRFRELIQNSFLDVNWFSFRAEDTENFGCCSFQEDEYVNNGQQFGLSPSEFFFKVFDLRDLKDVRNLVFVRSYWDTTICMNVISQLSYGTGDVLKIMGGRGPNSSFTLPPIGYSGEEVITFDGYLQVQRVLTFDWFRRNVICGEKPHVCTRQYDEMLSSRASHLFD
ncbi:uncharacterized protein LOC134857305 [Symsagittifera roscoffensis]|uniref:uncharacterized protein LOC134857305 n=1 Tax=Symsagittifera roscoffensis TaxID=84072 RepID=UPI00307B561D